MYKRSKEIRRWNKGVLVLASIPCGGIELLKAGCWSDRLLSGLQIGGCSILTECLSPQRSGSAWESRVVISWRESQVRVLGRDQFSWSISGLVIAKWAFTSPRPKPALHKRLRSSVAHVLEQPATNFDQTWCTTIAGAWCTAISIWLIPTKNNFRPWCLCTRLAIRSSAPGCHWTLTHALAPYSMRPSLSSLETGKRSCSGKIRGSVITRLRWCCPSYSNSAPCARRQWLKPWLTTSGCATSNVGWHRRRCTNSSSSMAWWREHSWDRKSVV